MIRVSALMTHPVQYQVPLWRELARRREISMQVGYFSDQGVGGGVDPGFGRTVTWDQPLLEGYDSEFLARLPITESRRFRIPDMTEWVFQHRPDVVLVHGYTLPYAKQAAWHRRRFGYRLCLHGEFTDTDRGKSFAFRLLKEVYLKWFYRQVDHFFPIGIDALRHLTRRGIPEARMTVTPYCVDDLFFEAQSARFNREECREKLGLRPDAFVVLFSGKMISRKEPLLLARALARLGGDQRLAAMFVGDGALRSEVESLLRPVFGDRLVMPGFVNQSELGLYFKAADVLALPSHFETWGLVVNEAMHFGLPCVVSDRVGAGRDLVRPGETGFVFSSGDWKMLSGCLTAFLDNPGLSVQMGANAHSLIQKYTVAITADRLMEGILHSVDKL